jgi:putative SbcD/Mre11-related phosphoesterase
MLTLLIPHPAALIKTGKNRTLVIADPHLGWETPLRDKGIHVPSQTPKLLQKLTNMISKYKPDALLIIGDVKYTVFKTKPGEWHDIPDFFMKLQDYVEDIAIVRGNHDANLEPLLPEKIRLLPATGTMVSDVGLFHGHKWPSPMLLKCKTLVMGHLHPVVVFRDPSGFKITRHVWVKARCNTNQLSKTLLQKQRIKIEGSPEETIKKHYNFKSRTIQIFIMPSFNDFLGGRPINEKKHPKKGQTSTIIGPVLRSEAVDLENSEIYLLDGTYLGTLNQLRRM